MAKAVKTKAYKEADARIERRGDGPNVSYANKVDQAIMAIEEFRTMDALTTLAALAKQMDAER